MSTYGAYSSYSGAVSHVQVQTCKFPGCSRSCYVETYGRVHDFCGRTHAQEYNKLYGYGVGPTTAAKRKKTPSISTSKQPLKAIHHPSSLSRINHNSDKIQFYNRGEPYYEFTNFYPCSVSIDGKSWPTTEHYFQAQKFVGTPYLEKIRKLPSPRDAFQLSRDPQVSRWRRADWETIKDDIMLKALRVKFSDSCSLQLRDKLRNTGKKELVEHTSNDSYWGDGGNGTGQNKLGTLLMQVRSELKHIHGPYIEAGPMYQSRSRYTRDDSTILQRQTPTPPTHKLRRSNSISSLAEHRPHTPRSTASVSSYRHAYGSGGTSGFQRQHTPTIRQEMMASLNSAKKTAKKGAKMVKQGASKAAETVSKAVTPITGSTTRSNQSSTGPRSTTRANQSSVNYDIVTNRRQHTQV